MTLLSTGIAVPSAAFPQYLGSLGASLAVVGIVVSLTGIGNMIIDLPSGIIIGRYPIRPIIVTALAICAACSVGIALAQGIVLIGLFTLVGGTSRSIIITAMMTYVRLTVPPAVRGRALSAVGGSLRAGLLIGPVVGGFISDRWGVPYAFGLQAITLAIAAIILATTADRPVRASEPGTTHSTRSHTRELVRGMAGRWRAFALAGTFVLVLQLLRTARSVFLPLWGDHLGVSATVIGAVMGAGAVMDLLLFVPAGQIMDRAGRKVAGSLCIGLFAAGVAVLPLTGGMAGFVIASMMIGLGNGFGAGINMTLGTDLAPRRAVGPFLGAWRLFGDIGTAAGPAIVGGIAGATGLAAALFLTASIGAAGLLIMAFLVPETLRIAEQDS